MPLPLENATILITGASGMVGRSLATAYAATAGQLFLCGRNEAALEETARVVRTAGGTCSIHPMDLEDAASIKRAIGELQQPVDVLINNAADVTSLPLLSTDLPAIERQIRTNVTGTLQLCRLVLPMMIERRKGAIVNVSSLAGYKPNPAQTVYSVTKAAMNAISDALRAELRGTPIGVTNVALMGVGEGPMRVPPADVARRIQRAVERGEAEVFFYRTTKWLMRLYGAFPALARWRG